MEPEPDEPEIVVLLEEPAAKKARFNTRRSPSVSTISLGSSPGTEDELERIGGTNPTKSGDETDPGRVSDSQLGATGGEKSPKESRPYGTTMNAPFRHANDEDLGNVSDSLVYMRLRSERDPLGLDTENLNAATVQDAFNQLPFNDVGQVGLTEEDLRLPLQEELERRQEEALRMDTLEK